MLPIDYQSTRTDFSYEHRLDSIPKNTDFKLHTHSGAYEILIFLQGNCEFRVEGRVYDLHPYDIVVAQHTEMHMMFQKEPIVPYERIVIMLTDAFFIRNNCTDFKKIFTDRPLGIHNLLPALQAHKHQVPQILSNAEQYLFEQDPAMETVLQSKLTELLYHLNQISVTSKRHTAHNGRIKDILLYINENITADLSLELIAKHFFINKYHLCHLFKQETGLTVNKYITYKRILLVRELYAKGASLTAASMEAGFGNYSNFYKMYLRETGKSPKADLSRV